MLIALKGDVHGEAGDMISAMKWARKNGISVVVQLGDFGIWYGRSGEKFLKAVNDYAAEFNLAVFFVDGNHEAHPLLRSYIGDRRTVTPVASHVFYMIRGGIGVLGELSYASMGGAVSVDKHLRVEGQSWWPEEEITEDDLAALTRSALTNFPRGVDVMFSHDCPSEAVPPVILRPSPWPAHSIRRSTEHRQMLSRAMEICRPKLIVHGHYHCSYTQVLENGTKVVGLAHNERPDSLAVLDTETLRVEFT